MAKPVVKSALEMKDPLPLADRMSLKRGRKRNKPTDRPTSQPTKRWRLAKLSAKPANLDALASERVAIIADLTVPAPACKRPVVVGSALRVGCAGYSVASAEESFQSQV